MRRSPPRNVWSTSHASKKSLWNSYSWPAVGEGEGKKGGVREEEGRSEKEYMAGVR